MTQQVASTTALVLGFLLVLLLGGRLIRYFGIAAEGRLDIGLLFSIIGYNLPYFMELLLPLSFFIALMLVFGRLYVDHEMAVINSSGVSRGRLGRLMTPLIITLFLLEAGLSLFGKPWGVRQSDNIWQQQALTSAFDLIRPQSFISSDDYHLYVGGMSEDNKELNDIILIQTSQQLNQNNNDQNVLNDLNHSTNSRDTLILAKRAVQVDTPSNSSTTQLDLYQGRRYDVGADSLVYNQVSFERYRISIDRPPTETVSNDNIETQSLSTLLQVARNGSLPISDTGMDNVDVSDTSNNTAPQMQLRPIQAELGYRFALPWLIIIAPMLAIPLAQVRPRQGRWLRLLPAILIFTSCVLVLSSLKNSVAKGDLSVWSYAIVIVAFVLLALYLNWASRIHHRVRFGFGNTSEKLDTIDSTQRTDTDTDNSGGQS